MMMKIDGKYIVFNDRRLRTLKESDLSLIRYGICVGKRIVILNN